MSRGGQLGTLLLAAVLSGCAAGAVPSSSPAVTPAPTPTEPPLVIRPTPTADPCQVAVSRVGTAAQRVGDAIAALRPLVVSKKFNAAATLQAVRRVSTLMAFDANVPDIAAACASTEPLAASIETLFVNAGVPVAASLKAGFHRRGQRKAAVALFKLLPAVVAISESNLVIATDLQLSTVVLVLPDGAAAPLGKLPKLR